MDWGSVVWATVGFLGILIASVAHYRFWVRRLTLPMRYARFDRLETEDGSAIEMRRLPPPSNPESPPVLLVHGVAANHRNLDAEPERSLARVLSEAGRDVWLVTLRSGRADAGSREPPATLVAMARYDLPLAVEHILQTTYAKQIDFVGFSMGGVVLCGALADSLTEVSIRRAVVLGSPGVIHPPHRALGLISRLVRALVPAFPLRFAARMSAFAADILVTPVHRWVCNPANIAPGSAGRAMVNLIEDVKMAQIRDFADWIAAGTVQLEGTNVLDRIGDVAIPVLFLAGSADRLAPPSAVQRLHDAWGSRTRVEKQLVVVGEGHGAVTDYGHGDLVVGRHVVNDVFVPIRDYLA